MKVLMSAPRVALGHCWALALKCVEWWCLLSSWQSCRVLVSSSGAAVDGSVCLVVLAQC